MTPVTLFTHEDLYLMFQIGVAIEFGVVALVCAAALNAMRRARVRVRRTRR